MVVLEFGCGIGVFLPELARTSGKVFAIDLFPEYAKLLSQRLNLDVTFVDSLSQLPARSLDIIIAADVLEHVADVDAYLEALSRLLKEDGRLIVSGPTETLFYRLGRILAGFGKKAHYHRTDIDRLAQRIARARFEISRVRTLPFAFPPYLFKVLDCSRGSDR
jgi:2-polyprenyl-3-methyl-5-hydroxy-6-metoxy-1,4-benzoquinol methylase